MEKRNFVDICTINAKSPDTWKGKIILTFDLDWCSDKELEDTLTLLEAVALPATFLCTHHSTLLNSIQNKPHYNLGIHPNFDNLLNGTEEKNKCFKSVLDDFLKIVPSAKICRSHTMTQSNKILNHLSGLGIRYELNTFLPWHQHQYTCPWISWDGQLQRLITTWEDDLHIYYNHKWSWQGIYKSEGLNIFNFHPIHIYLNTSSIEQYELYKQGKLQRESILNQEIGIRHMFTDLIEKIKG